MGLLDLLQSASDRTIIQRKKFEFADQFCLRTTILPNKRAEMFESLFVFLKQIKKKIGPNQKKIRTPIHISVEYHA